MPKRKKHLPAETTEDLPLTGREPFHPPAKNWPFLLSTLTLFLGWLAFLIWLALKST